MQSLSDHLPKCASLFNGNDKSPCPLPCTTFQIRKQIISSSSVRNKQDPGEGRIRLRFSSIVKVSTTDFVKPSLTRYLTLKTWHKSKYPWTASWQRSGAQWASGLGWGWSRLYKWQSPVSNGQQDSEILVWRNRYRKTCLPVNNRWKARCNDTLMLWARKLAVTQLWENGKTGLQCVGHVSKSSCLLPLS